MATINQTKIVKYFTKFACERVNVKLHIFAGKHTLLRDLGCFGIGAPLIGQKLLCRKQLTVGVDTQTLSDWSAWKLVRALEDDLNLCPGIAVFLD